MTDQVNPVSGSEYWQAASEIGAGSNRPETCLEPIITGQGGSIKRLYEIQYLVSTKSHRHFLM